VAGTPDRRVSDSKRNRAVIKLRTYPPEPKSKPGAETTTRGEELERRESWDPGAATTNMRGKTGLAPTRKKKLTRETIFEWGVETAERGWS